eukprot:gene1192-4405_t
MDSKIHNRLCSILWHPTDISSQRPWFIQGFEFVATSFGCCYFIQHQNGPCGALASIQGLVIQEILWPSDGSCPVQCSSATPLQAEDALTRALSHSLRQAAPAGRPIHLVLKGKDVSSFSCASSFFLQACLDIHQFSEHEDLFTAIKANINQFTSPGGVVLFIYSLVLSCGLDQVTRGMQGLRSLVYGDSTCDQILVNMILIGIPQYEIDDLSLLKWDGMPRIGFLTAEEEFSSAMRFLNPLYPIWVIHCGGHYSVLFSCDESLLQACPPKELSLYSQPTHLQAEQHAQDKKQNPPSPMADQMFEHEEMLCKSSQQESREHNDSSSTIHKQEEVIQQEQDPDLAAALQLSLQTASAMLVRKESKAFLPKDVRLQKVYKPWKFQSGLDMIVTVVEAEPISPTVDCDSLPNIQTEENEEENEFQANLDRAIKESLDAQQLPSINDSSGLEYGELEQAIAASLGTYAMEQQFDSSCNDSKFEMHHWNGLNIANPFNSIRVTTFDVYPCGVSGLIENSNPLEEENKHRKIKQVIDYKVNPDSGESQYLVVCYPDGSMEGPERRPPTGERWRCRSCYLQEPPVWSAFNDPESLHCKECGHHISECGFCHWINETYLPTSELLSWKRAHRPDLEKILARRFPKWISMVQNCDSGTRYRRPVHKLLDFNMLYLNRLSTRI